MDTNNILPDFTLTDETIDMISVEELADFFKLQDSKNRKEKPEVNTKKTKQDLHTKDLLEERSKEDLDNPLANIVTTMDPAEIPNKKETKQENVDNTLTVYDTIETVQNIFDKNYNDITIEEIPADSKISISDKKRKQKKNKKKKKQISFEEEPKGILSERKSTTNQVRQPSPDTLSIEEEIESYYKKKEEEKQKELKAKELKTTQENNEAFIARLNNNVISKDYYNPLKNKEPQRQPSPINSFSEEDELLADMLSDAVIIESNKKNKSTDVTIMANIDQKTETTKVGDETSTHKIKLSFKESEAVRKNTYNEKLNKDDKQMQKESNTNTIVTEDVSLDKRNTNMNVQKMLLNRSNNVFYDEDYGIPYMLPQSETTIKQIKEREQNLKERLSNPHINSNIADIAYTVCYSNLVPQTLWYHSCLIKELRDTLKEEMSKIPKLQDMTQEHLFQDVEKKLNNLVGKVISQIKIMKELEDRITTLEQSINSLYDRIDSQGMKITRLENKKTITEVPVIKPVPVQIEPVLRSKSKRKIY